MVDILMRGKAKIPEGTLNDKIPRPNHEDFMTSAELKKAEFTGIRHNQITDRVEVWTLGDMRGDCPFGDNSALAILFCRVFKTDRVTFYKQLPPRLRGKSEGKEGED